MSNSRKRAHSVTAADIEDPEKGHNDYISLTTHEGQFGSNPIQVNWGHPDPMTRGPVIATVKHGGQRNAVGAHGGGYCIYTALAVASGELNPDHIPNLQLTHPTHDFGPFPSWKDPKKIVTIDPWGHMVGEVFEPYFKKGYDIRPTIAVTKAHIDFPEVKDAVRLGRLKPDGVVLKGEGQTVVTKAAIEHVWYLPGIAERFGCSEQTLRQALFRETNMMYPELLTRTDIKLFLPPIGGETIYMWGDVSTISDEKVPLTVRVHDECNGSDVFGSDICTCRPYLAHAIEECIKTAQTGGCGVVVYFRKEGRSLGEVTKYLVYNMRKRAEGGDQASEYFNCTRNVAGITDTRFQALMPDALHWLGITKIDRFISMSDMKYDAIVNSGIKIVERVEIPPELIPNDAQVEIMAKVHVGYHGGKAYTNVTEEDLKHCKGRGANEY
jgi:GTP cyclohydrolase II